MSGALAVGARVAGRYELRGQLASTPAFDSFTAFDRDVEVEVALWWFRELFVAPGSLDRFVGAAVEMRSLHHPHLLRLFDAGHERGRGYVTVQKYQTDALPWSPGAAPGRLVPDALFELARPIAQALDALHAAGQVHGRLIPSDVVHVAGLIKVGGAGLYSEVDPAAARTVWGDAARFWAPEMGAGAAHAPAGSLASPASDVYSLAAILCELAAGTQGAAPEQSLRALAQAAPAVHAALSPALAVAPHLRPTSPMELLDALAEAIGKRRRAAGKRQEDDEDEQVPTTHFVKMDADDLDDGEGTEVSVVPPPPPGGDAQSDDVHQRPTEPDMLSKVRGLLSAELARGAGRDAGRDASLPGLQPAVQSEDTQTVRAPGPPAPEPRTSSAPGSAPGSRTSPAPGPRTSPARGIARPNPGHAAADRGTPGGSAGHGRGASDRDRTVNLKAPTAPPGAVFTPTLPFEKPSMSELFSGPPPTDLAQRLSPARGGSEPSRPPDASDDEPPTVQRTVSHAGASGRASGRSGRTTGGNPVHAPGRPPGRSGRTTGGHPMHSSNPPSHPPSQSLTEPPTEDHPTVQRTVRPTRPTGPPPVPGSAAPPRSTPRQGVARGPASAPPAGPSGPIQAVSLKPPSDPGAPKPRRVAAIDRPEMKPVLRPVGPSPQRPYSPPPDDLGRYAPPRSMGKRSRSVWLLVALGAAAVVSVAAVVAWAVGLFGS